MKVVKGKNLKQLNEELRGIEGVATALGTHMRTGIPDDEKKIDKRRKIFGSNTYKKPRPKGFLVSIYRTLREFAILNAFMNLLAAFILFVAAYSIGSCIPSSACKSKAIISGDEIEVLRGGESKKVSKSEIVVGGVVCLKIGDKLPADGLFLRENNLQLVEEGDSEISDSAVQVVNEVNPFLFSGSQVVDGYGGCQMMVSSVGMKEFVATAFTIVVVVIPESLRLGVALTTFYSKKRMMADMEMVSDTSVSGCETMGSVTTIRTSKTGILTMNRMVKEFYLGEHSVLEKEAYLTNASTHVKNLLKEGITLNTSRSTPTDKAILSWAVHVLDTDIEVKSRCPVLRPDHRVDEAPLNINSQKKKRSGVLMKREVDNTVHVHWKGEAEAILKMCSNYNDISISGNPINFNDEQKVKFRRIVQHTTERSLQCIAFAHNQVELVDGRHPLKEDGLVLLGLVGIKDVKMLTSDNISLAEDIARECGILLDIDDQEGAVITVSGNISNDVFALLEADVGISMGNKAGTDVVKKVSNIVILDDNFVSVARLLKSTACAGEIPLDSSDVLWLNLIVNTLASLALATERPTEEPIKRQPVGRKEPLISNIMLRNLLGQVVYQILSF
ncbi:calcium-transporting ATPase 12, plasma membrane-type-like [Ziziphus jujuba]|uniref:Calcium-transporting ATPase 12, plasma membrane-type-like n=1 Tax=Ziziphus jujuba TaxID=326968 RepID=A0ABM4A3V0_ZIZJJ|nr:calcium-transporting ATPase 12, plasma membrane-type-like [Ziziphus jujuba]